MRASALALPLILAVAATANISLADYVVVDLTPLGSTQASATSIFNGQIAGFADVTGDSHAWLYTAPAPDLHPAGDSSAIYGLSATIQVGNVITGPHGHATMWSGTPASFVTLNDTGYSTESNAAATHGGFVVGTGVSDANSQNQSLLWNDPATIATAPIALATPGTFLTFNYIASSANSINNTRVVGSAMLDDPDNLNHAAAWNVSTPGSPVFTDIHPVGFTDSIAAGVYGDQVVGFGNEIASGVTHAILWDLSADAVISAVDLNPVGFVVSLAGGINANQQVGFATDPDGFDHAMLWNGTAGSAVDLSLYLPAGFVSSQAYSIDASGNIVGSARDSLDNLHAILWSVPEPATLTLLVPTLLLLKKKRR